MLKYPKTKKSNVEEHLFGIKIQDPYRWMENEADADLMSWIEAQKQLTRSCLDEYDQREQIKKRLKELYDYPKYGMIAVAGTKIIYGCNDGLKNQFVYYIQEGLKGEPEVLIDPNTLSEDGTISITLNGHSKNNQYLAFLQAQSGSDWQTLKVMDLEKKQLLDDELNWVKFTLVSWYKDGFFYSAYDRPEKGKEFSAKNEHMKVYYHQLGEKQSQDRLIFSDPDHPLRYHRMSVSEDENYLILSTAEGTYGNETRVRAIDAQDDVFRLLFKGFDNSVQYMGSAGDDLFFLTDKDALNKKIVKAHAITLEVQDLIGEAADTLENAWKIGDKIVGHYLKDVVSKISLFDTKGQLQKEIEMPGIGSAYEFEGDKQMAFLFFTFGSFTSPIQIYSLDLATGQSSLFKEAALSFDPGKFITEQIFCESKDGTKVPIFITRKRDLKCDGKNPTLLYAYGGFNISLTPAFDPSVIYLLEKGGIFAQASLRGGAEYGEAWHKGGMLLNKQNVFDDFIAAAECLIEKKYTSSQHLAIHGRSNGGLLMGAVTNQRPDLFAAVFAQVGVMDMLRYHKFTLGWGWAVEYGNPDQEEHFKNILKYSPLHNIKEKDYPSVMVMTADHDDRVVPAHSFKYIATLQEKNTSNNPVIIRVDQKAGHGLGKSIEKLIQENADKLVFLFQNLQGHVYHK